MASFLPIVNALHPQIGAQQLRFASVEKQLSTKSSRPYGFIHSENILELIVSELCVHGVHAEAKCGIPVTV